MTSLICHIALFIEHSVEVTLHIKEGQDFPTKFSFSTSNFYGLPKVHKSKIIQEAIQVQKSKYMNHQI